MRDRLSRRKGSPKPRLELCGKNRKQACSRRLSDTVGENTKLGLDTAGYSKKKKARLLRLEREVVAELASNPSKMIVGVVSFGVLVG